MVLSQISSFFSNARDINPPDAQQGGGLDSITLGQLKAMVGSAPKPKVRLFLTLADPPLPINTRLIHANM